jgi:cell division protein FtsB
VRAFLQAAWKTVKGLFLTVVVCALIAGTGYAFLVEGDQHEIATLQTRLDHVRRDVDEAQRENRRLKALITRMKSSDELVEKIAREDAGLIKEGEILYVFPD